MRQPPRTDIDQLAATGAPPVLPAVPVEDHEPLPPADDELPLAEQLMACLAKADAYLARATAHAARLLGADATHTGGLPLEQLLGLEGGWTRTDRRMLLTVADTLRHLPHTARRFATGDLSWGQVRAIVLSVQRLNRIQRARVDQQIAEFGRAHPNVDPDVLVDAVETEVARLRPDLARRRERRAVDTTFLSWQPRLNGAAALYGEFDPEAAATIQTALDNEAGPPHPNPVTTDDGATGGDPAGPGDDPGSRPATDTPVDPVPASPTSRARQLGRALTRICEAHLTGPTAADGGSTRPRPTMLVAIDIADIDAGVAGTLLTRRPNQTPTLTARLIDRLACDTTLTPIIFDGGRPVAVGTARDTVTATTRTAVVLRDGGCRFPGCTAPIAWCDVHHLTHQAHSGSHDSDNLALLCRRHHTLIHTTQLQWQLHLHPDGRLTARRGTHTYTSLPRHRRRLPIRPDPRHTPTRGDPP